MEIKKDILEPLPGFSREIGYYLAAWSKARASTLQFIEDLSPEELAYRVLPNLHSIGALTLHLGEAEFYWMQFVVAKREVTEEEKKFSHWCDTLEADFERGYTAGYCLGTLEKISQMTGELLAEKTDADLEVPHLRDDYGEPMEISLRSILQRMIDHEAHHRGQIAMIKRLLLGGETATK
jgi:uncharacterized damage-inducible protein DinB